MDFEREPTLESDTLRQSTTANNPRNYQGPPSAKIQTMFSQIASQYDIANTILSAGIHHRWRADLVKWSGASQGARVLDAATGTGDLAIAFKRVVGEEGYVVGTDFCEEMLKVAPLKAAKLGLQVGFQQADVMNLPFADNAFDIASISFGIRNVQDPLPGLNELARVVRPGGVVMILEFGQPAWKPFRQAYQLYARYGLPRIGGWITGKRQAYEYLQASSQGFPCGDKFINWMESTRQFSSCEFQARSLGIAYLYKGTVRDTAVTC